jgi:two-component system cell cycle response regulator DivK
MLTTYRGLPGLRELGEFHAFHAHGILTACLWLPICPPVGSMAKVLLVEDNEMNRDMLSRRLSKRGFDVLMAVDGADGVEMARAHIPDLILMDMSLPVLDGWDAARQLKSQDATRMIPLIALTAHAMAGDREKALEAGCDDYDTKPIELPRLLEKMDRLLGERSKA